MDNASLSLLLCYTMNSLFWGKNADIRCSARVDVTGVLFVLVYLTTQGVDPQTHNVKKELVSEVLPIIEV